MKYKKLLYLHKTGDTYEVSEWDYFSLQRTHGDNVLALVIKYNTVDACPNNSYDGMNMRTRGKNKVEKKTAEN